MTADYTAPTHGSRYNREDRLDIKEIAKKIRAEIKLARKAGVLPVGKVSVRLERFSMGQAIRVEVQELSPVCGSLYNVPERADELQNAHLPKGRRDLWTPIHCRIVDVLEGIVNAWNYDNSDSMTDYFDVNYYTTITIDEAILETERAECDRKANDLIAREDQHEAGADWAAAFWAAEHKAEIARHAAAYAARCADNAAEVEDADERERQIARAAAELADAEQRAADAATARAAWLAAVEVGNAADRGELADDTAGDRVLADVAMLPETARAAYHWLLVEGWYNFDGEACFSDVEAADIALGTGTTVEIAEAAVDALEAAGLVDIYDCAAEGLGVFVCNVHDDGTPEHSALLAYRAELCDATICPDCAARGDEPDTDDAQLAAVLELPLPEPTATDDDSDAAKAARLRAVAEQVARDAAEAAATAARLAAEAAELLARAAELDGAAAAAE